MSRLNFILKYFRVESLIDKKHQIQPLPSSKEVYTKTIHTAWPSAVESLLIALISIVDMIMVSSIGTEAVAAVGIVTQPRFLIMSFVLSINIGTTVIVARRKGANDALSANIALKNAVMISVVISFLTTTIGSYFAPSILSFAGPTNDYIDVATIINRIYCVGTFG